MAALLLGVGPSSATANDGFLDIAGKFVCDAIGPSAPLVGARPTLFIQGTSGLFGGGPVFLSADRTATPYTGSDGSFRFTAVPSGSTYWIEAGLDDAYGTNVRAWGGALPFAAATNHFPASGTRSIVLAATAFPGPTCALFDAVRQAVGSYVDVVGSQPPYGDLQVYWGGPTQGFPWADGSAIEWPPNYAVGDEQALKVAAAHVFATTVENFAFDGTSVLHEALRWDVRVRRDPCSKATPEVALYEGFASFWAGDYAPAPNCAGVSQNDPSVEGMVAWRLTRMEHFCKSASRAQMVHILLKDGKSIRSIDDLAEQLGPCNAGFLDVSRVQRIHWTGPVDAARFMTETQAQLLDARREVSLLSTKLDAARHAADHAVCPPIPCGSTIAAKIAPSLLSGAIAQERLRASTLAAEITPGAQKALRGPLTAAYLKIIIATPEKLARGMASIGASSIAAGLKAAAPILQRDHSQATVRTFDAYVKLEGIERDGARGDHTAVLELTSLAAMLQLPAVAVAPKDRRTAPVATGRIDFAGIADGTKLTRLPAASFGGPHDLHFPGTLSTPKVCDGAPTISHGAAVAPICAAGANGQVTGTMIRLNNPAKSVSVRIGLNRMSSYGLAGAITAYDAAGHEIGGDAAVVGSTSGPSRTLTAHGAPNNPIAYLLLSINAYFTPGATPPPQLLYDSLTYTGP